jgi:hypothetical protein
MQWQMQQLVSQEEQRWLEVTSLRAQVHVLNMLQLCHGEAGQVQECNTAAAVADWLGGWGDISAHTLPVHT